MMKKGVNLARKKEISSFSGKNRKLIYILSIVLIILIIVALIFYFSYEKPLPSPEREDSYLIDSGELGGDFFCNESDIVFGGRNNPENIGMLDMLWCDSDNIKASSSKRRIDSPDISGDFFCNSDEVVCGGRNNPENIGMLDMLWCCKSNYLLELSSKRQIDSGELGGDFFCNSDEVVCGGRNNPENIGMLDMLWCCKYLETDISVEFVSPANGSIFTLSGEIIVNITNSSEAVYVWWNNGTQNLTYTSPVALTLADGIYTFNAYVNDSLGNVNSTSVTFTIQKDTAPPNVEFKSPQAVSYMNTNVINVSILASDASGISDLKWDDGTANQTITSPFSTLLTLVNGAYTFYAYATDNAGNINSTSVAFSVDYDATVPHISDIKIPLNGGYYKNSSFYALLYTDKVVNSCTISFNGFVTNNSMNNINGTSFNYTTSLGEGFKFFNASCKEDVTNRYTPIASVSFYIDSISPVVRLVSPRDDTNFSADSNILFKFNVSDTGSIDYCRLLVDGDEENRTENPSKDVNVSLTWKSINRANVYDWKVECRDKAGNNVESAERSVGLTCPSGKIACGTTRACLTSCSGGDDDNDDSGDDSGGPAGCTSTCTSMGYQCGTRLICGGYINCGSCASGNVCNASGRCITSTTTTTPSSCTDTCASLGYSCGQQSVCSNLQNCGDCEEGFTCDEGICEKEGGIFWIIMTFLLVPIGILIVVIIIIMIRESRKKAKLNSAKKPASPQNPMLNSSNSFQPRAPF